MVIHVSSEHRGSFVNPVTPPTRPFCPTFSYCKESCLLCFVGESSFPPNIDRCQNYSCIASEHRSTLQCPGVEVARYSDLLMRVVFWQFDRFCSEVFDEGGGTSPEVFLSPLLCLEQWRSKAGEIWFLADYESRTRSMRREIVWNKISVSVYPIFIRKVEKFW